MHYGSSKEEACSEEEARAQDRRGEEDDGEENGHPHAKHGGAEEEAGDEDGHRPSQDRQEKVTGEGAGATGSRACPTPKGEACRSSNIRAITKNYEPPPHYA